MSQVAIVIDVPDYGAEVLSGNALLRVAGNTVQDVKKLLPVDNGVRLLEVAVAPKLHVEQEWPVPVESDEPEKTPEPKSVKPKAKAKKPAAKKPAAKKA